MRDDSPLRKRTWEFSLRVVRLVDSLPNRPAMNVIGTQLLRCATSVGANYRAACRARSLKEFVAKLGIVEEEADESCFWLDLLVGCGAFGPEKLGELQKEANEIVAMIVASSRTAKRNLTRRKAERRDRQK